MLMRTTLLSFLVVLFGACIINAQDPILHLPFEGNTQDISGNGKHGIPSTAGVSYTDDAERGGQVLVLDGVEGIVDLDSEIFPNETDTNMTITCWFNWAGGGNWQRVYSLGNADNPRAIWKLMYFSPRDGWDGNNVHVTFHAFNPDAWYDFLGDWGNMDFDTIVPDKWYFCAVILKEDSLKIWMDDKLVTAEDSIYVTPQKIQHVDSSINVIGQSHWADPTFNGMIDDFRIYNEALSDAQIVQMQWPTGISDVKLEPAINLYGLDGRIMYSNVDESSVDEVSVYSITGSLLYRTNDLSKLPGQSFESGIYLVNVKQKGQVISRKISILK